MKKVFCFSGSKSIFLKSGCSTPILKGTWDRPLNNAMKSTKMRHFETLTTMKHYYNQRIMEVDQGSFTPLVFKGEWWSQSEKCPNTEFFLVHIFLTQAEYGDLWSKSPYAYRVRENTDEWVLYFHAVGIAGECKMFYSRLGSLPLIKPAIKNSQITA